MLAKPEFWGTMGLSDRILCASDVSRGSGLHQPANTCMCLPCGRCRERDTEASYELVFAHWEPQDTCAAHRGWWHLAESGTVCIASHLISGQPAKHVMTPTSQVKTLRLSEVTQGHTWTGKVRGLTTGSLIAEPALRLHSSPFCNQLLDTNVFLAMAHTQGPDVGIMEWRGRGFTHYSRAPMV